MRRVASSAVIALSLLLVAEVSGAPPGKTKPELALLAKIAGEWIELGRWAAGRKLAEQSRSCLERAKAVDPEAKGLEDLAKMVAECGDGASEGDLKSWPRRLETAAGKVAGTYEKLYFLGQKAEDPADEERFLTYLMTAVELAPSDKRWANLVAVANKAVNGKEAEKGLAIANRALGLKPPAKIAAALVAVVDKAAENRVVLMAASRHPMRYFFSLPKGYRRGAGRKWPVLICVEGAGSAFKGIAQNYLNARGDLPFLIVSPCSFSNTNQIEGKMLETYRAYYSDEVIEEGNQKRLDWDEAGVLAVIEDLKAHFDAEDRVYVTGFSGGGNITYMMVFQHPDMLNGAAPACANFTAKGIADRLKADWKFTAEDIAFPLRMITGEKDPHRDFTHGNKNMPGIEPQSDWAEEALKALGYSNYKRTMVPGMGHSAAQKEVVETFRPYWEGRKKRTDPLD